MNIYEDGLVTKSNPPDFGTEKALVLWSRREGKKKQWNPGGHLNSITFKVRRKDKDKDEDKEPRRAPKVNQSQTQFYQNIY